MSLLRVERVSWASRDAARVLQDVSLELDDGVLAGVHGRRGSGKTTLAQIASGRLAPEAGTVLFEDHPLSDAARVGFASRDDPGCDDLTAAAWIASALVGAGSWRTARRRAGAAIERVGLGGAAALRWAEMSDREHVLATLAQAIVRGPRLIVVDDPITGMAEEDRGAILDLLRGLTDDGVAVLATAVEPSELAGFDVVWALEDGRLAGPPPRPAGQVVPLRARNRP
ncbi:ATP-binding cassette domain-containing protein [Baekduia sp. Peel2402]|uniref:ATP-binding cassette domain-containing protein n=1 Tax=Baekduia sp. Peel2402 TaxID=3458296 RepID=UPI00403E5E95